MTILGLIPARGGSKGISRKNLKLVGSKPLIAWTIEVALKSRMLDRVIVSTEDEEISQIAREWGAEVPFLRPAELAKDDTPSIAVVEHALQWLENHGGIPEYTMLLQPTSPFRNAEDIYNAIKLAQEKKKAVVSICPVDQHPYLMKRLSADNALISLLPDIERATRRQDLPPIYILNGAIYLNESKVILSEHTVEPDDAVGYIMSKDRSIDIDTEWDLLLANIIVTSSDQRMNLLKG